MVDVDVDVDTKASAQLLGKICSGSSRGGLAGLGWAGANFARHRQYREGCRRGVESVC